MYRNGPLLVSTFCRSLYVSRLLMEPNMSAKAVSQGQLQQVAKLAKEKGVDRAMFGRHGLDGPDAVIPIALEAIKQGKTIRIVETLKSAINLADFFKTRDGLWVSEEFQKQILASALGLSEIAPASVGEPYDLPKGMTDAEILSKLGNKIFENPRAFLNTLARLIDEQWGGKEGDLLNNGYANIFYVRRVNVKGEPEVFVVDVRWDAGSGRWCVDAYRLVDRTWRAGGRAFPSN